MSYGTKKLTNPQHFGKEQGKENLHSAYAFAQPVYFTV